LNGANSSSIITAMGTIMEDPRLGLSIDNESASCTSDLSDSQASWEDYDLRDDEASILLLPASTRDLPRSPSFRSRIPRREEDEEELQQQYDIPRRRRETASSWDDDVRIARHPRAPSLRFCLTLFTLTLVLLSLTNNSKSKTGLQEMDFRREEILLPSDGSKVNSRQVADGSQLLRPKNTDHLPKREMKAVEGSSLTTRTGMRARANMAMARSAETRPVFGATPSAARIDLERTPPRTNSVDDAGSGSNWTSWLAAVALIAMLLETGYKEYRLCRMDDVLEEQRRL